MKARAGGGSLTRERRAPRAIPGVCKRRFLLLALVLALAACSRQAAAPAAGTAAATAVSPSAPPPATATLPPSVPPPPTPVPTPAVPAIAAADQPLTDEGILTLAQVISPEAGWVAVYAQAGGEMGQLLGFTAVPAGRTNDVTVTINPRQATPAVVAMLHVDEGEIGQFEYPNGPDGPLLWQTAVIARPFTLDFQLTQPAIIVADQAVGEEGVVQIESALATTKGWLVLQADDAGSPGGYLGAAPVGAGLNQSLIVTIPWREATPRLYATLLADAGRPDRLDFGGDDPPMLANGNPLFIPFAVTLPPDVYVLDQPVIDGRIEVERVISNGPGWLVVYFDDDGEPGLIIGAAPLADGLNERVVVEVIPSAVTPQLFIRLHEDTEPGDEFDFPRVDPPIMYDGRLAGTFSFGVEPGNYLEARDQAPLAADDGQSQVIVDLAVVDIPAWMVIQSNNNGERGPVLGFAPLVPGINRDVAVTLTREITGDTLFAVLYEDRSQPDVFESVADRPLQRNARIIQVLFSLVQP